MQISTDGKLGLLVGLLALAGGGSVWVAPNQTEIGWAMIGIAARGGIMLGAHHFQRALAGLWAPSDKQRMIALVCMTIFGLGLVASAGVYFWPKSAPPPASKAEAQPVPSRTTAPPAQTTIHALAEDPLPPNAKFRYRGKVFWASPNRYTKDEAGEMRTALREVYDCINTKSTPIVSSWNGPAVMFTRNWMSLVQAEGPQSAIEKLNDIRNRVIAADTELQEILSRRPYYRQDMMIIINDRGEVGDMSSALNDLMDALRKMPDKPTADLIKLAIGPSEVKFETAVTKYTNWIYNFNTQTLLLREELETLLND